MERITICFGKKHIRFRAVMKNLILLIMLFGCSFSIGCARTLTTGKYFDISKSPGIKDGITTKGEILSMFGQPHNRSASGNTETWTYDYSVMNRQRTFQESVQAFMGNIPPAQMKSNMLIVTFVGNIVETHYVSMSGSDSPIYK